MSASSRPVATPLAARPSARLTAVVDLPTPPLPEATAMMCLTPGTSIRAAAAGPCPVRGGGAAAAGRWAGRSAVMTAEAESTPGRARTACSQAWRKGSSAAPRAGSTSRVTATCPPRVAMPLTMPSASTSFPEAGSMTVWRTPRTADSVISAMSPARRLIEGMPVVTYMQPDMKAKAPRGGLEVRMAWNNNSGGPWGGGGGGGGGPWGGGGGGNRGGGPFGSRRPPDMEDVIRRGQERLRNLMPGALGSFKGIVLIALAAVVIWL